jgi:hypothetical protein
MITSAFWACIYIIGCVGTSYCIAFFSEWMFFCIRKYSVEEAVPLPTQIVPLNARPMVPPLTTKLTKVQPARKYVVILNPGDVQSLGSHIV